MISCNLTDLFYNDSIHKDFIIEYGYFSYGLYWTVEGTITNDDLHEEDFNLTESLCSESELKFGCCEASEVKFRVSNIFQQLKGKLIKIFIVLDGNAEEPFELGTYRVYSDTPTADRSWRDIVAYDDMTSMLNEDPSVWYNELWEDKGVEYMTLKEFRHLFFGEYCSIKEEDVDLPNDNIWLYRNAYVENITGKDIANCICELNGCFGHIGRDRIFRYVFLEPDKEKALYPSNSLYPSETLYPFEPAGASIKKGYYKSCKYEDFVTQKIEKLQIRFDEEDIGSVYPDEDFQSEYNVYSITNNFLVYGKTESELQEILANIYEKVKDITYRPFSAECIGNPCLEVGDVIRLNSKNQLITSYALKRTLKGIQSLKDSISSSGVERYSESNQNAVSKKIIALKNTTNKLVRTSEETLSKIESITLEQGTMSSEIRQNSEQIGLKVSKGDVSSQISVESGQVTIGSNRLVIDSENLKITGSGEVEATGKVSAMNSENKVTSLENGRVHFYYDETNELGNMGGYSTGFNELSVVLSGAELFSHRIGVSGYYFLNNGGNPNNYTERHYFRDSARMENLILEFLSFDNGQYFQKMNDLTSLPSLQTNGNLQISGSLACGGTKNRIVKTDSYGTVGMNAFETAGAYFSDIGSGIINDGVCYVYLDPIFLETIDEKHEYQVFLTRTSKESTDYVEKHKGYFIVHGEDNATFDWMITAKQKDYQDIRMESLDIKTDSEIPYDMSIFYSDNTSEIVSENYMEQLESNIENESVCNALDYMEIETSILESEE